MTNAGQENDRSVALMISWHGFNYFIAGGLTRPVEERLLLEAVIGDVDAYHASHHGAETSSSHAFRQQIGPEIAIVSNGDHPGFHHPRLAVLDTPEMVPGITIFQTNRLEKVTNSASGLVGGNVGNDDQIQDIDPEGQNGGVVIRVGAASYTVTVPRSGLTLTFAIERSEQAEPAHARSEGLRHALHRGPRARIPFAVAAGESGVERPAQGPRQGFSEARPRCS